MTLPSGKCFLTAAAALLVAMTLGATSQVELREGTDVIELEPGTSRVIPFTISSKQFATNGGKQAYLEIVARVQQNVSGGYTPALKTLYNGEELRVGANRNEAIRIKDGRDIPSYEGGKGWTLAYGPSVESIQNPSDQGYMPENPNLDVTLLLLPLGFEGAAEYPSLAGEIVLEAAAPEFLSNNVVVERVRIVFLTETELPGLE